jgi:1-acyl-sn-glycerol-3-phosphate acyltransferase
MKRWFPGISLLGWTRFRDYAKRCQESGFMPKRIKSLQFVGKILARIWLFVQVGKVRVVGRENLDAPGRVLFCINHSSMFDAPVIFTVMKKQPRYMTAVEEMRGLGGLKAVAMGAMGSFPVDRSRGRTAVPPAVEALVNGEHIAIFPEGKISNSGAYLKFKTGAARIAIEACDRREHRVQVAIVPIHMCFHRRDEATAGGPYSKMGFKWRGGVTVTIGKPVYIHNVEPLTASNVTDVVRAAITSQECEIANEQG